MTTSRVRQVSERKRSRPLKDAAYFLSLRLRNVRCFDDDGVDLPLSDKSGKPARWTILLGKNGSGKTTVLQSLAAFEPVLPTGIREGDLPWKCPRIFKWLFDGNLPGFAREKNPRDAEISASVGLFAGGSRYSQITRHAFKKFEYDFKLLDKQSYLTFDHLGEDAPICYGYGASRRLGRATVSGGEASDATESLFRSDVELVDAEEWLLRLDYSASKPSSIRARQQERRALAERLLIAVLPDIEAIRFSEPTKARPTPTIEFKSPYGWVPLRQLSHGYQTLIAWIVDLASRMLDRYPNSPDPLAEPAVVLVDEIDLHLHPAWQRKLIGYLTERFPNTQFIATAHSPLIVQAASDANIALLKRVGDHVEIINDVEDIKNWRVDQILTSDLFGLESARPPQIEGLLKRREELLSRPKLSKKAQKDLAEIEAKIGDLPTGESREERDLMRRMDATLKRLEGRRGRGG